jgi:hypothetical protein
MPDMMPPIIINVLSAILGDERGVGITFGKVAVTVDNAEVAGIADRVRVTLDTSCEAVAFWVGV